MKLELKNSKSYLYCVTVLYVIFCLVGVFYKFDAVIYIGNQKLTSTISLFDYWKAINPALNDWKLIVLIIAMFIVAIIIDIVLIKFIYVKFSKEYKIYKYELAKKYKEIKNEKE